MTKHDRHCGACGVGLPEDARFCPGCGREVPGGCISCHADLPPNARFCPQCGIRQVAEAASPLPQLLAQDGERRQLTVMFCDVVGSTKLSTEIDVEDLREVLRAFQGEAAAVIEAAGGLVARYMGDGILAYFGYPTALEDAPRRAASAGLEILRRIDTLNHTELRSYGVSLALRIGLHTGVVIVGEMGSGRTREEHSVVGEVPNIAAFVESCAPPHSVAVSAVTRDLIAPAFKLEALGQHRGKGLERPIELYRILEQTAGARREPRTEGASVLGRDRELGQLLEAWADTNEHGRMRIVNVSGEPGIGKSGLIAQFLRQANIPRQRLVRLYGVLEARDSAFVAVLQLVTNWLSGEPTEDYDLVTRRVRDWFADNGVTDQAPVEAILRMWRPDRAAQDRPAPAEEAVRDGVFAAFARFIAARSKPLAIVIEDAHWMDPSTIELLDAVLTSQNTAPIFFLAVSRPDHRYPWDARADATLPLYGLGPEACADLIARIAGSDSVEGAVVRQVFQVTDGVPLYVEELTRSLLDNGHVVDRRGRLGLRGAATGIATPTSLLDLLTSRLDALGPAKQLAQVAAIIGRTVPLDELAAVAMLEPGAMDIATDRLIASGHMRPVQSGGHTALEFRHALFQKAAYDSLLKSQLKSLHARYMSWLDKDETRRGQMRPERLAWHCEGAGYLELAVDHLMTAGTAAMRASANLEAARHLQHAAELNEDLDASQQALQRALKIHVLLAGAFLAAKGPGAPETKAAYDEAVRLSEETPESEWHFPAYWGWWRVSDTFTVMATRAERLVDVSERMTGLEFKLQARHCKWANAFQMGDLTSSMSHAVDGLKLYDDCAHDGHGLYGGHDAKVCALGEIALCKWMTGDADGARAAIAETLEWAETLDHPGSILHALDIAAMLACHLQDGRAIRSHSERLADLAEEHEVEDYAAKSQIYDGWRIMLEGDPQAAHDQIQRGLSTMRDIGTPEDFPVFYAMLSECLRSLGRNSEALTALDNGRSVIDLQGVTYWGAELERLAAEVLLAEGADVREITEYLDMSCDIAKAQDAQALQLRTAMTRVRLAADKDAVCGLSQLLGRVRSAGRTPDTDAAEQLLGDRAELSA